MTQGLPKVEMPARRPKAMIHKRLQAIKAPTTGADRRVPKVGTQAAGADRRYSVCNRISHKELRIIFLDISTLFGKRDKIPSATKNAHMLGTTLVWTYLIAWTSAMKHQPAMPSMSGQMEELLNLGSFKL